MMLWFFRRSSVPLSRSPQSAAPSPVLRPILFPVLLKKRLSSRFRAFARRGKAPSFCSSLPFCQKDSLGRQSLNRCHPRVVKGPQPLKFHPALTTCASERGNPAGFVPCGFFRPGANARGKTRETRKSGKMPLFRLSGDCPADSLFLFALFSYWMDAAASSAAVRPIVPQMSRLPPPT